MPFIAYGADDHFGKEKLDRIEALRNLELPEDFRKGGWKKPNQREWLQKKLKEIDLGDTDRRYYLQRYLFFIDYIEEKRESAHKYCSQILPPIRADIDYRWHCLLTKENRISNQEKLKEFKALYKDSRELGLMAEAAGFLMDISWIHSEEGNISEALYHYIEAQQIVPKEAVLLGVDIKFNLATLYIVHGDEEYIQKGIDILLTMKDEILKISQNANSEKVKATFSEYYFLAAFNIGIAYALHQHDYEKALEQFQVALNDKDYGPDALSFGALAAAKLGKFELAEEYINRAENIKIEDEVKNSYLKCYRSLARYQWQKSASIEPCFNLHKETTVQVLEDINHRLVRLENSSFLLRSQKQYIEMYENKILPEFKKRTARAASNNELKRLEVESRIKDEKIIFGEKIQKLLYVVSCISVLLLVAILFILRAKKVIKIQSLSIARQKRDLQHILDNIDEGIILVDQKGRIKPVFSKFAEKIISPSLDSLSLKDFLSKLGQAKDELAKSCEVFNVSLGEEELAWSANSYILPTRGSIGDVPFDFHWTPVVEKGLVNEVIISVRDASDSINLQKETDAKERLLSVIQAGSIGFEFLTTLKDNISAFRGDYSEYSRDQILRIAHTAKGEARSLKFKRLVDSLHEFEQEMMAEKLNAAEDIVKDIESEMSLLMEKYQMITGDKQALRKKMLLNILQTIFVDANERLAMKNIKLNSRVECEWPPLTNQEINALHKILSHSISNSVDHGYLFNSKLPEDTDEAEISVKLWQSQDRVFLEILDKGGGVDWEGLAKKAKKMGIEAKTKDDLTSVIFLDSVSSLDSANKTSGRGVGMAVVAEEVKELGGTLKFTEGEGGRGTILAIAWSKLLEKAA